MLTPPRRVTDARTARDDDDDDDDDDDIARTVPRVTIGSTDRAIARARLPSSSSIACARDDSHRGS